MAEIESPHALADDLRTALHHYVDMLVPLRPDLYGYCRVRTGIYRAPTPAPGASPAGRGLS